MMLLLKKLSYRYCDCVNLSNADSPRLRSSLTAAFKSSILTYLFSLDLRAAAAAALYTALPICTKFKLLDDFASDLKSMPLHGKDSGSNFFQRSSRPSELGSSNWTENLRPSSRPFSSLDTNEPIRSTVSTIIITIPGKRVISRTTRFNRRVSSAEAWPPPFSVASLKPLITRTAPIRRASRKQSRTTAALALPLRPRSCGKSTTLRGFVSSKPIAAAASPFPDPTGPQNRAVVPWRSRMASSKPHMPNRTPRAFSISTMARRCSRTVALAMRSSSPESGTTRSSKPRICSAPRVCFLQPLMMSASWIIGAPSSRPTAVKRAERTAFLMNPPVSSYCRATASQSMSSSQGMAACAVTRRHISCRCTWFGAANSKTSLIRRYIASSRSNGRFVASRTMPSNSSSCARSSPTCVAPPVSRLAKRLSHSSKKRMASDSSASRKTDWNRDSLLAPSAPSVRRGKSTSRIFLCTREAIALAVMVLPVPEGPQNMSVRPTP
mmetsp:Transcript_50615/g.98986  ORF Transcript_50615/g.98986 Transcript_50615/m.98986 type:complete len:495 (+) Transcript_50615:268-1752(+)